MVTRRRDVFRVAALVPLLALGAFGRRSLFVDVENLAMKSVGTTTADAAAVAAAEFGSDPVLVLWARPRVPALANEADRAELAAWTDALRAEPDVASLEQAPGTGDDERCLLVHVRTDGEGHYAQAIEDLGAVARGGVPPAYRLAISGTPAVEVAVARELEAERARILPILVAGLAGVLGLVHRSVVLVLGALAAPLLAVFLLEGFQGFFAPAVDPVSALLGPAVLTVGVASSVHVLEAYLRALRADASVARASRTAARGLRVPLLLTATTTVAGFLGLLASPIPAVRRFGWLASLGTALAIALALLELPSLLRLLHRPPRLTDAPSRRGALRHARWVGARAWPVTLACALLGAVGLAAQFRHASVDNDPLHLLASDHPARREAEEIGRRLGGSEVFQLLLPPAPGGTGALRLAALVGSVSALDGVVGPAGTPARSPRGSALASFLMAPASARSHEDVFAAAEGAARAAGWPGARATGLAVRIARDSGGLVAAQRAGILTTLAGLFVVMAAGFRSWRLGLLGLVPNVLPLVLVQGALALSGRPSGVASSMIGTVMLGLVVDDTIHLLHAHRLASGAGVRRMARTLLEVRRPIVVTTAVLCVGFCATLLGDLRPTVEFGALAVATLVLALLADLFLLPALLLLPRPRTAGERSPARFQELSTS